tara:strand:+ start:486 stop:866 length:381 start_codon:yes stop_codon:yes gene_type:complete
LQIELENIENNLFITAYGKGYVVINKKRFKNIIFVNGYNLTEGKKDDNIYENIFLSNIFKNINKVKNNDLFLFGTGENLLDLPEKLKIFLIKNTIKFEIMNSLAAYKTHNILLHEGRNFTSIIKVL